MKTYPVGAMFMTQILGPVGFLAALGQLLCGKPSSYSHCGLIVTADGGTIEAQPGGARPGHMDRFAGRTVKVCDGPVLSWLAARHATEPGADTWIRARVAQQATALIGTGYSGWDYVALGLLHLGLPSTWVRNRVERSGRMICSQAVDAAFRRSGIHLWSDDRLPGDVMPADLADWADNWEAAA